MIGKPSPSFGNCEKVLLLEKDAYLEIALSKINKTVSDPITGLYKGEYNGRTIGLIRGAFSPGVAIKAEQMALYFKTNTIIRIGTCGSLTPEHRIGTTIAHHAAIKDEGTSLCYIPPNIPATASPELLFKFITHTPTPMGLTWTTDGRYAESEEKINQFRNLGATTVEMETSALYTLGLVRKINTLSLSIVSDCPFEHEHPIHNGQVDQQKYTHLVLPQLSQLIDNTLKFLCSE